MLQQGNNYAYIDSQNIHLGVRELGWTMNFKEFRLYLLEEYAVQKAYLFIGYLFDNESMYRSLEGYGYELVFKPILRHKNGDVKGNVDADLVLQAMIDFDVYDKAVIVTSDGDFHSLVHYLYENEKLERVLSPDSSSCSALLKKSARERIAFIAGQ